MTTLYQQYLNDLSELGAHIENGQIQDFGNLNDEILASDSKALICPLDHLSTITVSGDDAADFLQNQLSNDIKLVNPSSSQISSYSSAQGRLYSILRIFLDQDRYVLSMPASITDKFIQRLKMFVLRAKVNIEDTSETLVSAGISGQQAQSLLKQLLGETPDSVNGVISNNGITIIRIADSQWRLRWLFLVPSSPDGSGSQSPAGSPHPQVEA